MIKVEALEDFNLKAFDELKNIVRKTINNEKNKLYQGDVFECDKEMADYLLGNNVLKRAVVRVIEVEPIKEKEPVEEEKKVDITENEFEIRSDEVKELVDKKIQEVEEIIKPKSNKKSSKK